MINQFIYSRERRRFGRQCLFGDRTQLMVSIVPTDRLRVNYVLRNPVNKHTQLSFQMATNTMETVNVTFADHGMYHYEGAWPKEININDEEATLRYRKKIEREDNWGGQIMGMLRDSINVVLQNNAVNIYQDFFEEIPAEVCEYIKLPFEARKKNIFHDPCNPVRPITAINWLPGDCQHFIALHSNLPTTRYVEQLFDAETGEKIITPVPTGHTNDFFVWDLDNPLKPTVEFDNDNVVCKAAICPKDDNLLSGGLNTGKVCLWDAHLGGLDLSMCQLEVAHREPASALCWVHSKTNTEFYTASLDGSLKSWDARDLDNPLFEILLDPRHTDDQNHQKAHGATVLEFEYTIPVRFIVGTDMGSVFIGNRKGTTPTEIFAAGNYRIIYGPIRTIERNPFFVKNFLITGDWCARIWAEECKSAPSTMLIKKKQQVLCGTWSTLRCSLFVTGDISGELDFWDLLMDQRKPVFTMKFPVAIVSIRFRSDGEYLAVGLADGDISILEVDYAFKHCTSKDKALISAVIGQTNNKIQTKTFKIYINKYLIFLDV